MTEAFEGTRTKWLLSIVSPGFDMDRDNFELTVRSGSKSVSIPKSACFKGEDNKWYFTFDTDALKPGSIDLVVTAYVPDDDFDDDIRVEVDKIPLIKTKKV